MFLFYLTNVFINELFGKNGKNGSHVFPHAFSPSTPVDSFFTSDVINDKKSVRVKGNRNAGCIAQQYILLRKMKPRPLLVCYKYSRSNLSFISDKKMTKLMEWIGVFFIIVGIWYSLITEKIFPDLYRNNPNLVLMSPIFGLGLFAMYSVLLIAYRVYNFNDCFEAAEELKNEIQEAKKDLAKKGLLIH